MVNFSVIRSLLRKSSLTICSLVLAMLMSSSCIQIQEKVVRPSKVEKYCRRITGIHDGYNQAMHMCIQQEENARAILDHLTIPAEIADFCRELSSSTGGSYQVMLVCVQNEMAEQ